MSIRYSKAFAEITTSRLIIRPVIMDDAEAYFEAEQASRDELASHWSWVETDKSINDIKAFINEAIEHNNKERPSEMYFSLLSKEGKYLGILWFYEIHWFIPCFEMHYWLDTRESGKGYMTEAVSALTRTCFDLYEAKRVQIIISAKNEKSIKLVEKLNFNYEAEMQNYFVDFVTNEIHNGLMFSCCEANLLPFLDIDIKLNDENQNNFLIRDILLTDFIDLARYFGEHTIYKKSKNHWQNYLTEHQNHVRVVKVVELNGQAVGFGTLKFKSDNQSFLNNNIPEINDILVAPELRMQGIGKALVESLENSARENKFTKIGLAVGLYADYGSAQRLYTKMGYVPDGLGVTYLNETVIPGESYPVDDDLLLWLTKKL